MRKISFLLFALFVTMQIFAQVPSAFNYQAVLRDATGKIRPNIAATVRIDLLQGSVSGSVSYAESFAAATDAFGVINLKVGNGTVISGTFSTISWSNGPYFMKVSIDGIEMGTSQLLSVPYALYAGSAGNGFNGNYNDLNHKPTILDTIKYNTATGYKALYSNTSGSQNTAIGSKVLRANTTGYSNTANGCSALYRNTTGHGNTANGDSALYNNSTGNNNTATGVQSLFINSIGSDNTAYGVQSLYSNNGYSNTAIGSYSLKANTSGYQNTAIGFSSLSNNTIGYNNTALGNHALVVNSKGNSNTAVGNGSLFFNGIGNSNTAVGCVALGSNRSGNWNTAIGVGALENNINSANTAVGYNALKADTSWDNTAIGYQALLVNTLGFDNVAVGFNTLNSNTIGCGNTAMGKNAMLYNVSGNNNTAIGFNSDVSDGVTNSAAIGYGASVKSSNKIVLGNASATTVGGYGSWTNYSDRRLKENIVYTNKLGLNFITRLKPASYNYIKDTNKRRRDGLIAQDVEQTLKEIGIEFSGLIIDDDKDKTQNLSYAEFVIPMITAMQELNQKNQQLQQQLEKNDNEMKAELEKLKQLIQNK